MSISKVVLITGSSTGFGRGAAEALARKGYTVFASMRECSGRNAGHRQALEDLAKQERLALFVEELDVTSEESVEKAVERIVAQSGRIDVVINNAGVATLGITEAYTVSQWKQLFEVNLFGVVRVNRAVLPTMRRQRDGLLIHVSSGAGRVTIPYFGVYCASKYALEALADAYRFELKPFGIDSVIVEPGIHRTPILDHLGVPEDKERMTQYRDGTSYADRVRGTFDAANASADTPGVEGVVNEFERLIEMPWGERPFRHVPTPVMQPVLAGLNATSEEVRKAMAHAFNTPELIS
jgi:NAD(P)-dependent dehydrogenase (short-subunit alcohol dehydrogenase family)